VRSSQSSIAAMRASKEVTCVEVEALLRDDRYSLVAFGPNVRECQIAVRL